ncbi:hypothetical protein VHEMI09730 [[Torrubiella] hemipterigena]|uniref:ABC transporter n=1 Tax=[Torrubiella] hemipterigena TaxID=1531966 RepID=A0A0A1TS37_9HYPO|nr:hypothetical protein VHEMI09730 [[Torrubiella] hemipterigena]
MNIAEHVRRAFSDKSVAIPSNDGFFGPGYNGDFDFTILFENVFFSLTPSVIALLLCVISLFTDRGRPTIAKRGILLWAKLVSIGVIFVVEIAKAVIWSGYQASQQDTTAALTETTIVASILSPIATIALGYLLYSDHVHTFRPSSLLSIYCTLSTVVEIIRSRTFLLRPSLNVVGGLSLVIAIFKVVIVVLQEIPKPLKQDDADEKLAQDAVAGFWNRTFVIWINSTLFIGFRRSLSMNDLGSLGPDFSSHSLVQKFERIWEASAKNKPHALTKACYRALFWPFVLTALPRLSYTALTFAAAFLLQALLQYLGTDNPSDDERKRLIAATFITYLGRSVSTTMYSYLANFTATRLRGMIVGQILKKNLRLAATTAAEAAALTHISADIEGILDSIRMVHDLWIGLLELAVGLYILSTIVGKAFFLPLVPIIISTFIGWYVGKRMGPATMGWNQAIQDRISTISAIMGQITGIKMIGLEQIIVDFIQGLRKFEIEKSKIARKIRIIMITFLPINYWFTPLVLVIGGRYWTIWKDGLEPVSVFTAFAFVSFLGDPVNALFNLWPDVNALLASFTRIQIFLNLPEAEDPRQLRNFATRTSLEETSKKPVNDLVQAAKERCISLLDVSINSIENDSVVLKNVNLSVSLNTLTIIIGAVRSGKSTLLKAFIGEAMPSSGKIQVLTKDIAYCGQSTWLPNITIRQAIIGLTDFDEERFQTVIRACALEHDIQQMEGGDSHMTGQNGSKLSGGQRQRLCLARAIYSLSPIVVCDDILSSLDAVTSKCVFEGVFGPEGFLQQQGRTAILATHATEWLPFAHQAIMLQNFEARSYTTPEEIQNLSRTVATIDAPSVSVADVNQPVEDNNNLIRVKEEVQNPASPMDSSLYRFYFQDVSPWMFALFLALILSVGTLEKFPDVYMRIWIEKDPTSTSYVWGMFGLSCLAMVINGAAAWLYQIVMIPKAASKMHLIYIKAVMRATLPYLTSTNNGSLLNRFGQDMSLLAKEMPMALYSVSYMTAILLTTVGMIVSGTKYAFVFLPFIAFILLVLQAFYLRTSRQMRLLDLEAKTPLYTKISETCSGIEHIRTFGWEDHVIDESLELLDYSQKSFYYMYSIQRWLLLVLDLTGTVIATILVAIALQWTHTTSQPSLGLSLLGMLNFSGIAQRMVLVWTNLETSLGSITRLKTFVKDTPKEEDGPDTKPAPDLWPAAGSVEFHHVSSSYSAGGEPIMALENINITINAGEKVVVTGRTGSGKSSFMLTILNFLHLTGTVSIDGIDISKVPREQLRRAITTLPQDPVIIPGTLRQNLLPFEPCMERLVAPRAEEKGKEPIVEDEEPVDIDDLDEVQVNDNAGNVIEVDEGGILHDGAVYQVLKDLGLEDYVLERGGLDVEIKLMEFSAGQKQLVAIARAMLHRLKYRTKIVLMDELTSSLDYDTDRRVQRALKIAFSKCTRIIISHRSTGLEDCDRILTLKDGWLTGQREIERDTSDDYDSPFDENEREAMRQTAANVQRAAQSEPLQAIPLSWMGADDAKRWLEETETETSGVDGSDANRPDVIHRRHIKASIKALRRAKQERDGTRSRKSTDSQAGSQRTVKSSASRRSNASGSSNVTAQAPNTSDEVGEGSQSRQIASQDPVVGDSSEAIKPEHADGRSDAE